MQELMRRFDASAGAAEPVPSCMSYAALASARVLAEQGAFHGGNNWIQA